jgi:PAS domain S-box-containing protein
MIDERKTKAELIGELKELRKRNAQLEALKALCEQTEEKLRNRLERLETKLKSMGSGKDRIQVSDINIEWNPKKGTCTFENLPVAMMWIDTTLAGLMSGVQSMVGTERFGLALQSEGRKSVEADWQVISQFPNFREGFMAIANIAAVAGWGDWRLISLDKKNQQCRVQVRDSWEGRYQKALGVCWGSGMLAGKMAGYCSKLFGTNCWAEQTAFIARGEELDEFLVHPSERSIEEEIENLLATDRANRADMAVALQKLQNEVNDRKRAEEELRKSEERFRELAELLPETIFEMDVQGNLKFVNRNAFNLFRYTQEDLDQGLNGFNMVAPEDRYRAVENAKKILRGEKTDLEEYTALRKDGSTFPAMFCSSTIFREGKPIGFRGFIIDITEKKKLQDQLQQAQKMEAIGTLAGGIAHDFNNILFSIIGNTEMSIEDVPEDSMARLNMEEILKAAKRARDMVRQILDFSRQGVRERKPLRAQPIIREALQLLKASLPSTIEIIDAVDIKCGPVLADPTQMHQIIMNLCTNAYHAMREKGGKMTVALNQVDIDADDLNSPLAPKSGLYLKLSVSDTGHGMERAIMERIFDPYFTTKEAGEGTGMGLSVVHGIVKSYGGDIAVSSEPGEGTEIDIYLPMIESAAEVPRETVSADPVRGGDEHILLVDDEENIVRMVQGMLEHLGYDVTARTSSVEALEAFRTLPQKFDIIITDQTMPNITGEELAKELLRIRPDIPIILCTGFSEIISEEKAKSIGIREYIMKPILKNKMARTIRQVLDEEKER